MRLLTQQWGLGSCTRPQLFEKWSGGFCLLLEEQSFPWVFTSATWSVRVYRATSVCPGPWESEMVSAFCLSVPFSTTGPPAQLQVCEPSEVGEEQVRLSLGVSARWRFLTHRRGLPVWKQWQWHALSWALWPPRVVQDEDSLGGQGFTAVHTWVRSSIPASWGLRSSLLNELVVPQLGRAWAALSRTVGHLKLGKGRKILGPNEWQPAAMTRELRRAAGQTRRTVRRNVPGAPSPPTPRPQAGSAAAGWLFFTLLGWLPERAVRCAGSFLFFKVLGTDNFIQWILFSPSVLKK